MKKIPVKRPSREQILHVRKELALVSKIRMLTTLRDRGIEHISPFSEEEEELLQSIKKLDESQVEPEIKKAEEELFRLQQMM